MILAASYHLADPISAPPPPHHRPLRMPAVLWTSAQAETLHIRAWHRSAPKLPRGLTDVSVVSAPGYAPPQLLNPHVIRTVHGRIPSLTSTPQQFSLVTWHKIFRRASFTFYIFEMRTNLFTSLLLNDRTSTANLESWRAENLLEPIVTLCPTLYAERLHVSPYLG